MNDNTVIWDCCGRVSEDYETCPFCGTSEPPKEVLFNRTGAILSVVLVVCYVTWEIVRR